MKKIDLLVFNQELIIFDVKKTLKKHLKFKFYNIDIKTLLLYIELDIKNNWKKWLKNYKFESNIKFSNFIFLYYINNNYGIVRNIIRNNKLFIKNELNTRINQSVGSKNIRLDIKNYQDLFDKKIEVDENIIIKIEESIFNATELLQKEAKLFYQVTGLKTPSKNYLLHAKRRNKKKFKKWLFYKYEYILLK